MILILACNIVTCAYEVYNEELPACSALHMDLPSLVKKYSKDVVIAEGTTIFFVLEKL